MTTIIEKYKPSKNELIKIKELSKDCPKLLEIFEEAEHRFDKIMKIIEESEDDHPLKEILSNLCSASSNISNNSGQSLLNSLIFINPFLEGLYFSIIVVI